MSNAQATRTFSLHLYHPQTKFGEGDVFIGACLFTEGKGGWVVG